MIWFLIMAQAVVVILLLHLIGLARKLLNLERGIMALVDDILVDVQDETTVVGSVVTLLASIKSQLDAAGTDAVKLAQVKNAIDANKKALADAVVSNTPAAPAP